MSGAFPSIPGFIGPFSLKAFLLRYFGAELHFDITPSPPGGVRESCCRAPSSVRAAASHLTPIHLKSTGTFAVIVYVAHTAPTPPALSPFASRHDASADAPSSLSSSSPDWSVGMGCRLRCGGLTRVVLAQPLWGSLLHALGPAAARYLLAYCALVVQYEPDGGGLQVLGPPLSRLVPAMFSGRRRGAGWRRKRTPRPADESVESARKQFRAECPSLGGASLSVSSSLGASRLPSSKACELGQVDASRRVLLGEAPTSCCAVSKGITTAIQPAVAILDRWLEELWLRRHPTSLEALLHSSLRPAERRKATQRKRSRYASKVRPPPSESDQNKSIAAPLSAGNAKMLGVPLVNVPNTVLGMVFPFTLHCQVAAPNEGERQVDIGDAPQSKPRGLRESLRGVLRQLLTQCSRFDLRGAALRHSGYLESRFQQCVQSGVEVRPPDVIAPVPLIVAYLRDLLSGLRYTCQGPLNRAAAAPLTSSFWGVDARSAAVVLDALCSSLSDWLSFGRRDVFRLYTFLERVPVGSIPWLRSFCTSKGGPSGVAANNVQPSTHASSSPRARRSMLQQRVFLQLVHFLTQHVLPYLVRRTFHVTWSPKNGNCFIFIPQAVWGRWVRREVRKLRTPSPSLSLEPLGNCLDLCTLQQRFLSATQQGTPLLYCALRLLPDHKKLRPIAVIRQAPVRSFLKIARGVPCPGSPQQHMVRRLTQHGEPFSEGVATPMASPKAHFNPMSRRGSSKSAVLQQSLRCLNCGLAERRRGRGGVHPSFGEYEEIRNFVEGFRRHQDKLRCPSPSNGEGAPQAATPSSSPARLTVLRGDAIRCYDRLPQAAALRAVDELLPHPRYYVLSLDALRPIAGPLSAGLVSRSPNASDPSAALGCPVSGALRRQPRESTISERDFSRGVLFDIPRGWIVVEKDPPRAALGAGRTRWIDGGAARATLRQHVGEHLLVLQGQGYVQRVGLAQGSAVSVLLCEVLLEAVEAGLARVLGEHEEPALLLRRVDDVLVLTLSAVAAQRCGAAMREGWPAVGYTCQPSKLVLRSGGGTVGWCGLLLHLETGEVSVEWARMGPMLQAMEAASRHGAVAHLVGFTRRLVRGLRQRTPLAALCRRINSKPRVMQTVYEMGLIWSRRVLRQVKLASRQGMLLHRRPVLARPLNTYLLMVRRLCAQLHARLVACHSGSELCPAEVNLCSVLALHRVLQGELRQLLAGSAAAAHSRDAVAAVDPRDPNRKARTRKCRISWQRSHRARERRMWWMLACFVSQRLNHLLRRTASSKEGHAQTSEDNAKVSSTGMSAVQLLRATGPGSISFSAAAAVAL